MLDDDALRDDRFPINPEFGIERSTGCYEVVCVLGSDIVDVIIETDRISERAVPIF